MARRDQGKVDRLAKAVAWVRTDRAISVAATLMIGVMVTGCTGPRPVLVDPVVQPTFDAAEFAASLPDSSREMLDPTDPSLPSESSAEDAIWAWGQRVGLDYQGSCTSASRSETSGGVCSAQEATGVFRIGPNGDETWWVIVVEGDDGDYRVGAVYPAGQP